MKTSLIFAIIVLTTVDACSIGTIGQALVAGHWRTSEDLLSMSHADERNTLIIELSIITSQSVDWLQGKEDDDLIEVASVAIFLRDANIRTEEDLTQMSVDDQRNTLITQLHLWTDDPINKLQAQASKDLVVIGCAFTGNLYLVAEVTLFEWHLDSSQLGEQVPVLLSEQLNNNCNSSIPLSATFAFNKAITESTTFEQTGEFRMDASYGISFEAKIPFLFKTDMEASVALGGTKAWGNQELNSVTETYTDSIDVEVPPGQANLIKAMMTIANIDVPYTMTVKTALNTTQVITGVWKGVSMAELQKTQVDVPCPTL